MSAEIIAILDFGSQYGQLIARRVREQNVYSRICRADITAEALSRLGVRGLILSGGPASVRDGDAPRCDEKIFDVMRKSLSWVCRFWVSATECN
jgi:GMP synthase (glutamine-hydrolysing)